MDKIDKAIAVWRSFKDDWDDDGALAFEPEVLASLERIWRQVPGDPIGGPVANGSLDLYWPQERPCAPEGFAIANFSPEGIRFYSRVGNEAQRFDWPLDVPPEEFWDALEPVVKCL